MSYQNNPACKTQEFYDLVINEVMDEVKGAYLKAGVSQSVIEKLKTDWQKALVEAGVYGHAPSQGGFPMSNAMVQHPGGMPQRPQYFYMHNPHMNNVHTPPHQQMLPSGMNLHTPNVHSKLERSHSLPSLNIQSASMASPNLKIKTNLHSKFKNDGQNGSDEANSEDESEEDPDLALFAEVNNKDKNTTSSITAAEEDSVPVESPKPPKIIKPLEIEEEQTSKNEPEVVLELKEEEEKTPLSLLKQKSEGLARSSFTNERGIHRKTLLDDDADVSKTDSFGDFNVPSAHLRTSLLQSRASSEFVAPPKSIDPDSRKEESKVDMKPGEEDLDEISLSSDDIETEDVMWCQYTKVKRSKKSYT